MATTEQYLSQLVTDKQTLVNNLVEKGVEATNDETFTSLVPKVAEIEGGSSKYAPRFLSFRECGTLTDLSPELSQIDMSNLTTLSNAFLRCYRVEKIDLRGHNISNVTSLQETFASCTKLTEFNGAGLDINKVTGAKGLFYGCTKLTTVNLSGWNTSNISDFQNFFYQCYALETLDLSSFTIKSSALLSNMFYYCESLKYLDIRNMDLGSHTGNTTSMFYGILSDCEIIVKDEASKTKVMSINTRLTNVKTVAELEA